MITVATAENALKNIYLETVINDINKKTNPFLTMVEENARVASGKEAKVSIRCGESAVGAGTETGDLPTASTDKQLEISVPLKNLYGTFQVSDKAMKAASVDPNAFASLLGGEMQNLVSAAQSSLTTMLYGNGKKILGIFDANELNSERKEITLKKEYLQNFTVGMAVKVLTAAGVQVSNVITSPTVTAISTLNNSITLSSALNANKLDRYYIYAKDDDGTSMNGIDSVFDGMPYGINLLAYPEVSPCNYRDNSETLGIMDESAVLEFFDKYEEHCQSMPADIILTNPRVKKSIFESLKNTRSNIAITELAGGFHGFSFNGIPMYSDVKCKAGVLYALNSKSFAMHQLCDWTWLANEDGTILKQQTGKATYMATLVKYADLLCDKPFLQGKCSNFSAINWK